MKPTIGDIYPPEEIHWILTNVSAGICNTHGAYIGANCMACEVDAVRNQRDTAWEWIQEWGSQGREEISPAAERAFVRTMTSLGSEQVNAPERISGAGGFESHPGQSDTGMRAMQPQGDAGAGGESEAVGRMAGFTSDREREEVG